MGARNQGFGGGGASAAGHGTQPQQFPEGQGKVPKEKEGQKEEKAQEEEIWVIKLFDLIEPIQKQELQQQLLGGEERTSSLEGGWQGQESPSGQLD